MDLINKLQSIVASKTDPRKIAPWWCRPGKLAESHPEIFQYVMSYTSTFPLATPLAERIYCTLAHIDTRPTCRGCGIDSEYFPSMGFDNRYPEWCKRCAQTNKEAISEFVNTRKNTCLALYGAKTNLITDNNKRKSKETCVMKYGTDNPMQSDIIKDKLKATSLARYGTDNPSKAQEVKDRIQKTMQFKYGCHISQRHVHRDVLNLLESPEWLINEYVIKRKPINQIAAEIGYCHNDSITNRLRLLGIDIRRNSRTSKEEAEITAFISSLDISVETTKRFGNKLECDVFLPSMGLGIEHNGIYWHSYNRPETSTERNRHLKKTIEIEALGHMLIQFTELEWSNQQNICKSIIKSKLGLTKKIYARKCSFYTPTHSEVCNFMSVNHIQGNCAFSYVTALKLDEKIVAIMTFGKSRFTKKYDWELLRYASILDTTVVGGFSKLLKEFERNKTPLSLVSYANRRWSKGNVYIMNGFIHVGSTTPNYIYINFKDKPFRTISRIGAQKHRLHKVLGTSFDPTKTEAQNMFGAGWRRMWDCGNHTFIKRYYHP